MILQYLQDEGYTASSMTIQDETNVKLLEQVSQRAHVKRMRRAILDGDWLEVEKLCAKSGFANVKNFQYAAYRTQYLELIEGQEYQKAFTHLTKRLKARPPTSLLAPACRARAVVELPPPLCGQPLESHASSSADFKDLCYLLTCKSVQEVLRDWDSITSAREQLAEQHCSTRDFELGASDYERQMQKSSQQVPPRRLLRLLQQAVAYQVEFSHYHPTTRANVQAHGLVPTSCPRCAHTVPTLCPHCGTHRIGERPARRLLVHIAAQHTARRAAWPQRWRQVCTPFTPPSSPPLLVWEAGARGYSHRNATTL